jgi:hypothetical protein
LEKKQSYQGIFVAQNSPLSKGSSIVSDSGKLHGMASATHTASFKEGTQACLP